MLKTDMSKKLYYNHVSSWEIKIWDDIWNDIVDWRLKTQLPPVFLPSIIFSVDTRNECRQVFKKNICGVVLLFEQAKIFHLS